MQIINYPASIAWLTWSRLEDSGYEFGKTVHADLHNVD